jgi:hypothetical protein
LEPAGFWPLATDSGLLNDGNDTRSTPLGIYAGVSSMICSDKNFVMGEISTVQIVDILPQPPKHNFRRSVKFEQDKR